MRRSTPLIVPAVLALLLSVLVQPALATVRKPDLTVTRVVLAQADVVAGEAVQVSTTVTNAGKTAARRSRARLYLSTDDTRSKSDKALRSVTVRRLAPGNKAQLQVAVTVPATVGAGSYHVVVCADVKRSVPERNERNNCRAGDTVVVTVPSSEELIDRAVEAGELDQETAVLYKVYALVDDERLPARYAGDDSATLGSPLTDAVLGWSDLSPATRELLVPFVVPPFYEGSHWSPSSSPARARREPDVGDDGSPDCSWRSISNDWYSALSGNGKVRIWWQQKNDPTDRPKAMALLDDVDTKIWPAMKSLMGREPLDDGGGLCSGPDSAIDVSMVDIHTDNTTGDGLGCGTSTHILLKRSRPNPAPWLAHELFHSLQFGYPVKESCASYKWLREATAQWFMDYVSSPVYGIGITPDNAEWDYSAPELYLERPQVSLDSLSPTHHEYGSYLFFFFLARFDTPNLIPAVWNNVGSMSSTEAARAPLGGNFDLAWREFVKDNWNRGSIDAYRTWDGLTAQAEVTDEGILRTGSKSFTVTVDHLAAKYLTFEPDAGVTSFVFDNADPATAGAGVQAIIEYADGTTKVEDWTGEDHVELCLTDPEVVSVTLVFSNSNIDPADKVVFDVTTKGRAGVCCTAQEPAPRPTGTTSATTAPASTPSRAEPCPDVRATVVYTETAQWSSAANECCTGSSKWTITLNLVMAPVDGDARWGWEDAGSTYTVTFDKHESGRDVDCGYSATYSGSGGGPVDGGAGAMVEKGDPSPVSGEPATGREWLVSVGHNFEARVTGSESWSCPNDSWSTPYDETLQLEKWVADDCPGEPWLWFKGAADARTFDYSCERTDEYGTTRTTTATISFG